MAKTAPRRHHPRRSLFSFSVTRLVICLVLLAVLVGAYFVLPRFVNLGGNTASDAQALVWHTVDVGQGDCTIVQFPDDKVLMVDTGKPDAYTTIVKYLQNLHITTIDWLVISHPDDDHYGAAPKLLANDSLTFKQNYCANYPDGTDKKTYRAMIGNADYHFRVPNDGEQIVAETGYTITFVSPYVADQISSTNRSNNSSLMMTIEYCNKVFVLTGDASYGNGTDVEHLFVEHATDLGLFTATASQQIILKVGHHGSASSSGEEFLSFIFGPNPQNNFALISCGEGNKYGHPTAEALARLGNYCAADNILVTKDVGDIVVTASESTLTINGKDYHWSYTMIFVGIGVAVVVLCFFNYGIRERR